MQNAPAPPPSATEIGERLPYISQDTSGGTKSARLRAAVFSECWFPIANGIGAAIAGLCRAARTDDLEVILVTPVIGSGDLLEDRLPSARLRLPSLPLPGRSGYVATLPFMTRIDRARLERSDVLHAHSVFVTGEVALRMKRRSGAPLLLTYHTRLEEYAHYLGFAKPFAAKLLRRRTVAFANRCDLIAVPTQPIADALAADGVVTPIVVRPSGIDVDAFATAALAVEREDASPGSAPWLVAGRLAREKNPELAVDALAFAASETLLEIAGDGPLAAALSARAAAGGVASRVRFSGAYAPADAPGLFARAGGLVFTSRSETQGLVLAEALAAGLRIIAVDSPVARDVLAGSDAIIVAPDARALGAALRAAPPSLPADRRARRAVAARFDYRTTSRATFADYRRLAGRAA